jgi:transposase InsO family protein
VAVTSRVLKFSQQGYYRWRANPVTERDWADAHLVNAALDIHADEPAFGYRFIADELPEKGITAAENRVQCLCRDHGIWSVFSKKRGLNRKPGPPVHDDLVERDFTAAAPNELWLTGITEHPTAEGKLCLCAVKDVYSGRIIGYSMDSRMKSSLAVAVPENAVRARRPAGTVVHRIVGPSSGRAASSNRSGTTG